MRLLLIITLATMVTLSVIAADLAGTWKGSMQTQMGDTPVTIIIHPGAALAGKVQIAQYEAPIENARLSGDKLSFEINIEHGKVTYEGTVAGDQMKLNVTGTQGDKYTLICKRQK